MKLGLMQPYFLPYLGYFSLIQECDVWVVFDEAQYIRRGWVNRNRILHPDTGWQYIRVPVSRHPREARISEVTADGDQDWGERIIRQLAHYKDAPHYTATIALLEQSFKNAPHPIHRLNTHLLQRICRHLGIEFSPRFSSDIDFDRSRVQGPSDWARLLAKTLGATEYLNPPGGREIYSTETFAQDGIQLRFVELDPQPYPQNRPHFESHLSVVDALMFNTVDQIRSLMTAR